MQTTGLEALRQACGCVDGDAFSDADVVAAVQLYGTYRPVPSERR